MTATKTPAPSKTTVNGTITEGTKLAWRNGPFEFSETVKVVNGRLVVRGAFDTNIPVDVLLANYGEGNVEIR